MSNARIRHSQRILCEQKEKGFNFNPLLRSRWVRAYRFAVHRWPFAILQNSIGCCWKQQTKRNEWEKRRTEPKHQQTKRESNSTERTILAAAFDGSGDGGRAAHTKITRNSDLWWCTKNKWECCCITRRTCECLCRIERCARTFFVLFEWNVLY